MAGVTALLDQKLGKAQGNLNPQLYSLAATTQTVFHDATVSSSGVSNCSLSTPSMCNNSIWANANATQAEQGYLLTAGFDEATGLGSIDVGQLLANYAAGVLTPPTLNSPAAGAVLAAGTTSTSLQWGTVSGATSYNVRAGASCGAGSAVTVTAPTYTLTGLANGSTYYWQVQAVSSGASSAYSTCQSFSVALPKVATPVISLASGTYNSAQTASITDATQGAAIYYTLNGTAPSTASTKYTGAIAITASETLTAIATATGYTPSATAQATYSLAAVKPAISLASGTYTTAQTVTITDTTQGATIYYTVNGATPTIASTKYTGPIAVASSLTLTAVALVPGFSPSAAAQATYTFYAPKPAITPAAGTYPAAQLVTIATPATGTAAGTAIYYTLDGSTPTTSSTKYSGPFVLSASGTVKAMAAGTGLTASGTAQASYTIYGTPWALEGPATAITTTTGTLNAVVNPEGLTSTYQFHYGTSPTNMSKSTPALKLTPKVGTPTGSLPAGTTNQTVSAAVSGLTTKTKYYYQVTVSSAGGTAAGAVLSFTTN
jgi:hypothetical protein